MSIKQYFANRRIAEKFASGKKYWHMAKCSPWWALSESQKMYMEFFLYLRGPSSTLW